MEKTLPTKQKVVKIAAKTSKLKQTTKLKPPNKKNDSKESTNSPEESVVNDSVNVVTTSSSPIKRVRRTKEELKDVYIDPIEMEKKMNFT